ncbi:hypothetical protein [Marinoscillum pacificum]|uniref:hypothetical protein n=1 Tax=Marinoscillum pacificum TaxID=392723 RepID=UPI0021585159|nr:hypothetical protein [Marinoscillum pacificum]
MTLHQINSTNLSNSLVFYRSLFNKMPQVITPFYIQFHLDDFQLEIKESHEVEQDEQTLHLQISDKLELEAINKRMSRFRSIASFQGNCEVLDSSIGIVDPDGTKWIVGDNSKKAVFEKCYVSLSL